MKEDKTKCQHRKKRDVRMIWQLFLSNHLKMLQQTITDMLETNEKIVSAKK